MVAALVNCQVFGVRPHFISDVVCLSNPSPPSLMGALYRALVVISHRPMEAHSVDRRSTLRMNPFFGGRRRGEREDGEGGGQGGGGGSTKRDEEDKRWKVRETRGL